LPLCGNVLIAFAHSAAAGWRSRLPWLRGQIGNAGSDQRRDDAEADHENFAGKATE